MKKIFLLISLLPGFAFSQPAVQRLSPVNFSQVSVTDSFWKGRMDAVATSTLQACMLYTENRTGRIRNFEKAAAGSGTHEGIYYDDSDVYKAIEAMAYSLKHHPDATVEQKADEWIAKIAAAQLPDGYLNTYYQLKGLDKRWTDMEKHEDYCAGHLIEAGIAYYHTTGKRRLLEVAIRFADHMDSIFRQQNRHWVSGHQEIELALMRLYHETGNAKYLALSTWFLEERGRGYGKGVIWDEWKDPAYCQDAVPVKDQREITGHAVRAMYMYTGAADVAAVTNDGGYINAMQRIWEDVVHRNMYITGGIGAQGKNEGFGEDYALPNESAYCETCASVGMVFWNQRMNMLSGNSKYTDVLEKSLYNGALDGLSLQGDRFFYGNPLASSGGYARREWFGTACCPANIARLVSSLGNYIYSVSANALWVQLYIGSSLHTKLQGADLRITQASGLPWKGNVSLQVEAAPKKKFELRFRLPGWLKEAAPGDLYQYLDTTAAQAVIRVNGSEAKYNTEQGYAVISRQWKAGDKIEIDFPCR
ncbi:MAG: glycoside hydrolase family 127 protein [Flavihumibacter sp.]